MLQRVGARGRAACSKCNTPWQCPRLGWQCLRRARLARLARLWAARLSQEEAGPLGAQPLPSVLEPAASQAAGFIAEFAAFDLCVGGARAAIGAVCHALQLEPQPSRLQAPRQNCSLVLLLTLTRACRRLLGQASSPGAACAARGALGGRHSGGDAGTTSRAPARGRHAHAPSRPPTLQPRTPPYPSASLALAIALATPTPLTLT